MRAKNKVIALDVDGVICDFLLGFTTAANQMDNSLPIIRDGHESEWDLTPWYCDKATLSKIWAYIRKNKPFFWTKLEPLISSDILTRLIYNHATVYFITARVEVGHVPAQRQTVAWLQRMFNLESDDFMPQVICSNRKMEVCDALNVDYYLDDKPDNLLGFNRIGTKGYILYKPYMRDKIIYSTPSPGIPRSSFYSLASWTYEWATIPIVYSVAEFLDRAGL